MASELIINPESGVLEKRTVVQGSISKAGYVRIRHNGKVEYVHRLIWETVPMLNRRMLLPLRCFIRITPKPKKKPRSLVNPGVA